MKTMTKWLTVLLVLCMALCLCACGEANEPTGDSSTDATTTVAQTTTTTQAPAAAFEVKVVDQNGDPVQGAMVQVCKDSCVPAQTDANGVAKFNIEITDGYQLKVAVCPAGYTYTGEAIDLESGATSYTMVFEKEA